MTQIENILNNPKVLIISNNALSKTNNNGKTLESFFSSFNSNQIAQLYFSSETPCSSVCNRFFRISDVDVIHGFFNRSYTCGKEIPQSIKNSTNMNEKKTSSKTTYLNRFQVFRLIRELFWSTNIWKSKQLNDWLDKFSPDIVYFCAGDSVFAYRIVDFIVNKFSAKLVVYITDDYVLPRKSISVFWWIRRNIILNHMRSTVKKSNLFITISDKMKNTYSDFIGKDSIVAVNMTDSLKDNSIEEINNDETRFVYTGGLHFNRYKTLAMLANSIKNYNNNNPEKQKVMLRIYSNTKPSAYILKKLNLEGASEFCGSLDPYNLKRVLNECSVPVHVESFDRRSIESTKLSISTKIPEYLSLSKPILAIGPNEVASMEYLSEVAYCITSQRDLDMKLAKFINDKGLRGNLVIASSNKYKNHHNRIELEKKFKSEISSLLSN